MKNCHGVKTDIQKLESWASIFTNPEELAATVTKHLVFNRVAIKADIAAIEADWANDLYKKAGTDLADLLVLSLGPFKNQNCWVEAYGRGVGKPISSCPDDKEKDGLLCYPKCREGYYGVGPVCWEYCPSDFRDDGAFCYKPDSYGRGAGSIHECENCEKWGLLWYPKCRTNFHNVACCVCSPDCPSGMTDIGISCAKGSYGRTAGTPLTCKSDEEYDAGLCYPPCENGANGVGPVCWGNCPAGTEKCGGALCLTPDQDCSSYIAKDIGDILKAAIAIALGSASGTLIDLSKITGDYLFPTCPAWNQTFNFTY